MHPLPPTNLESLFLSSRDLSINNDHLLGQKDMLTEDCIIAMGFQRKRRIIHLSKSHNWLLPQTMKFLGPVSRKALFLWFCRPKHGPKCCDIRRLSPPTSNRYPNLRPKWFSPIYNCLVSLKVDRPKKMTFTASYLTSFPAEASARMAT